MLDLMVDKTHETRQGEAYMPDQPTADTHNSRFILRVTVCAMNFSDTEVIASILQSEDTALHACGRKGRPDPRNTCSIRKAEQTVRNRLQVFRQIKQKTRFADRRSRLAEG